jgi:anaerobic magnesium-protoporphyrin IX monomethyl ester cyclase
MKINLVCLEDNLIAVGFRKMATFTASINPDTHNYFLTLANYLSPLEVLLNKVSQSEEVDVSLLRQIAEPIAQADIVGFSSMTSHAKLTKQIIREVKLINPKAFIIWGGVHPIIDPEDAITHCNAICTGEGEPAIESFLSAYSEGRDFTGTKNFWFNQSGKIIRNDFFPITMGEEMDGFPLPLYAENELIFKKNKGFVPTTSTDYLSYNGLAFNTVWSIGCPYECSFCGNTVFIENDKDYRKIRHPSVDWLIRQIKDVKTKHPHISTVVFHDDSFMAIPKRTIVEFAEKWKSEIGLSFCVQGVIPSFVKEDKFEILVDAGMNRVRMGIQSGSDSILEFYKRPNKPGLIHHSASIINKFKDYMIPPAYDIILDNPIETREDILITLELLYNLPRPYVLNAFSLRMIPNSVLEQQMKEREIDMEGIERSYSSCLPGLSNALIHLLPVWRPPRKVFNYLLKFVRPCTEKQTQHILLLNIFRIFSLFDRGWYHLRFMDFSVIRGRLGWVLWKLGVISFWKKRINVSSLKP